MATIGRFLAIRPDSCKNCTTDVARRGDHRRATSGVEGVRSEPQPMAIRRVARRTTTNVEALLS